MFWHAEQKLIMMVYVDDFKMSGRTANLAFMWERIRKLIKMDEPNVVGRCLGCEHKEYEGKIDGRAVRSMDYDLCAFMGQCFKAYLKVALDAKLSKVATLFMDSHVVLKNCSKNAVGYAAP